MVTTQGMAAAAAAAVAVDPLVVADDGADVEGHFACSFAGCDKTFTLRRNMLRHYRTHVEEKVCACVCEREAGAFGPAGTSTHTLFLFLFLLACRNTCARWPAVGDASTALPISAATSSPTTRSASSPAPGPDAAPPSPADPIFR
jgi:hypothetical protein